MKDYLADPSKFAAAAPAAAAGGAAPAAAEAKKTPDLISLIKRSVIEIKALSTFSHIQCLFLRCSQCLYMKYKLSFIEARLAVSLFFPAVL